MLGPYNTSGSPIIIVIVALIIILPLFVLENTDILREPYAPIYDGR